MALLAFAHPAVASPSPFNLLLSNVNLRPRIFLVLCALLAPCAVSAQTATLTAKPAVLDPAGGQVTFTFATTFTGTAGFGLTVNLPSAWAYTSGTGEPTIKPIPGLTGSLDWATLNPVTNGTNFTFTVTYPAGLSTVAVSSSAIVRPSSATPITLVPAPVVFSPIHSADIDADSTIGLAELTHVISLYNHRVGTVRTAAYRTDTEDRFAPGTGAIAAYHSADTDRDGRISLIELTRVIELFVTREGTARSGRYRPKSGSEDGFAPAPALAH